MKLLKRFLFYGIGLIIGSIFVSFIWEKKDVVFNYFPNARLLSNISTKQIVYSDKFKESINLQLIDTLTVNQILKNGDVDFWNKIKLDSCIQYNIDGIDDFKNITLTITNCDSIATINKVVLRK